MGKTILVMVLIYLAVYVYLGRDELTHLNYLLVPHICVNELYRLIGRVMLFAKARFLWVHV